MSTGFNEPSRDCPLCPRLVEFRTQNRAAFPDWHNGPVPAFGPLGAPLLIVGLAPGLRGANRTARPFTGDWAGDLLYPTLVKFGFARGTFAADPNDGLELTDCRITNAVRCVPPQNKPIGAEQQACRPFLSDEIAAMTGLRAIVSLGSVSHANVLSTLGLKRSAFKFVHGASYKLESGLTLFDSYHCSRYNTNTGRLTTEMFETVFHAVRQFIDN
ncbi:uracil-DNA glycosylase [Alphaproteobacteria bacterium HT1-32]|nr:uracil-DNA glycosylase [Alphaproteobacteria bacterium HT1-32]